MFLSSLLQGEDLSGLLPRTAVVLAVAYGTWKYIEAKRSPLNAIPTVGYSGVLTSYITALQWHGKYGRDLLLEGYNKYPNQAFKIAAMSRWMVILSGAKLIEDIRSAPLEVLSLREELKERFQFRYTIGKEDDNDLYHVEVIRTLLTRNLGNRYDDIRDEVVHCFDEYIPPTEDWTAVPISTSLKMVVRISNMLFVGLPLCRDPGYCALITDFAAQVTINAKKINTFPAFLQPLVGNYLCRVPRLLREVTAYLAPVIKERLAEERLAEYERDHEPNDLITWLRQMMTHQPDDLIEDFATRIFNVNFGANDNTSVSFIHAVYNLAIHPEYVEPMREEVTAIIEEEGWTKPALLRMRKVDSFLKESQRLSSASTLRVRRMTMKNFILSDGTVIPPGTIIGVAVDAMNKDENLFPDALTFKGFRFSDMRDGDGELDTIRHQMVSLGKDQVTFGTGRLACPGRFFAVTELKSMLTHVLLNYDVQLEGGSMERPPDRCWETTMSPGLSPRLMFRKRRV